MCKRTRPVWSGREDDVYVCNRQRPEQCSCVHDEF